MLQTSSVLLAADSLSCDTRDLLVNLCDTVPQGFEHFSKVVEVVSQADQEDRSLARARWRHYVAQGYQIVRHDLVLREGA
jgi:DNA polymerase-3 subunit chi